MPEDKDIKLNVNQIGLATAQSTDKREKTRSEEV